MRPFILGGVVLSIVGITFLEPIESLEYSMEFETSHHPFDARSELTPNNDHSDNKRSTWCSVAKLCQKTMNPVCGYDDSFGYGKFDDICHMLQVNCYWKYNFALVSSILCNPVL